MALFASRLVLLSLALAASRSQATCPAGEGYTSATSSTCVLCGAGTWSGEGSTECARCPPGTWSSVTGAVDASTCVKCPRGTWSSQEGSPTPDSCQGCSPGRWGGAEGLASDSQCTACTPGTWAAEHGATSSEVCTACPSGTWSSQIGSSSLSHCIDCAPGTWNDETGASALESCRPCRAGTWSTAWGASSESTCTECGVGTYQPALGQANQSVCIRCPPGKYGAFTGASTCASCPEGSWNDEFEKTACTVCPDGQWTRSTGSLRKSDCSRCTGSEDCLPDGSARIAIELRNFPYAELDAARLAGVKAALAEGIASACGANNESVVDLLGQGSSVTISSDGQVSAFVRDVAGSSANELAARLYSSSFRGELVNATLAILGSGGAGFGIGAISVTPEAFVPVVPTSTMTTSTSTVTTATIEISTTAAATTTTAAAQSTEPRRGGSVDDGSQQHRDSQPTPGADSELSSTATLRAAALPWPLMLCLGLTAGRGLFWQL